MNAVILFVLVAAAMAYEYDNYKDFNVDAVVANRNESKNIIDCFTDARHCNAGKENYRQDFLEALRTSCRECSDEIKHIANIFLNTVSEMFPDEIKHLTKKVDPTGKLLPKFLANVKGY